MKLFMIIYFVLFCGSVFATDKDQVYFDSSKEYLTEKKLKYKWAHDPFLKTPGFTKRVEIDYNFQLEGILFDKKDPMAIIDNRAVYIGTTLEGEYVVRAIGPNFVVIGNGDKTKELQLPHVEKKVEAEVLEVDTEKEF